MTGLAPFSTYRNICGEQNPPKSVELQMTELIVGKCRELIEEHLAIEV